MSQPTPYVRQFSFTNAFTSSPTQVLPGASLDAEFNATKATIDQILQSLKLLQNDDGTVKNGSIGSLQLSTALQTGFLPPVAWTPFTAYTRSSTAFANNKFYSCILPHSSSSAFATDLAAGKWSQIADLSTIPLQSANNIAITPSGGIVTTDVQSAMYGLDARASNAAPTDSPTFTGAPAAPTAASSDNSTRLQTTAGARTLVAAVTLSHTQLSITDWAITAVSSTNPATFTIPGHTLLVGDDFFVKSVGGATGADFKWFRASVVVGNVVTVHLLGATSGYLVDLGNADGTAWGAYTTGGRAYPQITRGTFAWPASVEGLRAVIRGSGAAGGGSAFSQLAGAGAGGAVGTGWVLRPVGGTSPYVIDRGMPGIQANVASNNNIYAGPVAFGTFTFVAGNPATPTVPVMTGDLYAYGAGIGQASGGANVGGDGGAGGIAGGTLLDGYYPGGQGQASNASILDQGGVYRNVGFPAGAAGSFGGGVGGNNGQDGQHPGGGGAPGYDATTVNTGFDCTATACTLTGGRENGQSGAGGAGMIDLYFLTLP